MFRDRREDDARQVAPAVLRNYQLILDTSWLFASEHHAFEIDTGTA